ncbi:MAG TPA: hypothetical protein VLT33_51185, partial [Labilithrix sp.]|nr:hypothetical protein [Labilithrix sp.]
PDASAPAVDCPAPTAGPTVHTGDVKGDEVWTAAASPHVLDANVNVRDGAKLTIEPCAEVLLAKGAHIQVAYPITPNTGTLIAEGTAAKPIRFHGKDGARWGSIYAVAPGTVRLAHVTLEGGGGGDFEHGATLNILGNGEMPADAMVFLDHVTIKGSLGVGLFMQRGASFIAGSKDLVVSGSGSEENPYPLEISEHAIDALPTGTFTGNKVDEILLRREGNGIAGSGLVVDATLHDRGVPYQVGVSKNDDFVVGGGEKGTVATLTIEAGVVMKFNEDSAFEVQHFTNLEPSTGAVRALGTAERPIVFTTSSKTPRAGAWRGFWFGGVPQATNQMDHVRIEYAGADCGCSLLTCSNIAEHEAAVIFTAQPPSAFITNTVFKDVAGHGVNLGFDGVPMDFKATNTFEGVAGCEQTRPRNVDTTCPSPKPACD